MWIIILLCVLLVILYLHNRKSLKYWEERGVPFVKPWPFLGNMGLFFLKKRSQALIQEDVYKAYPHSRYVGIYNFSIPILIIRDPNLIKQITVKDFDIFPDHRNFLPDDVDPLWSKNLFAMKGGQQWQDMRSTLSPSYTGSKMRIMFELMKECSTQFTNHFLKYKENVITLEMKDTLNRFTNDVIATTAFGVTCDSLEERENKFYLMGKEITDFGGIKGLKFMLLFMLPSLAKLLKIPIYSGKTRKFFGEIISDSIKIREEKGIVRPDMLQLLMEARKGRLSHDNDSNKAVDAGFAISQEFLSEKVEKNQKAEISDEDITAQALLFFFAGSESVSTTMCYAAYELAVNPDVQQTLRREVDETLANSKNGFTYETLLSMKYLDMVITETLRKWPPFIATDRRCVRPYTIEADQPGEKPLHLEAGTTIHIPIFSMQRDSRFYPDPDKFDPERYSSENKHNIKPYTFVPFGSGPRNCIGSRFAVLESKLIIAEIVSKFEIVPVEKTSIPIQIGTKSFIPLPDEGIWLGLKPRNSTEGAN